MAVDDLQQQTIRGSLVQVRNAASARSRGFELDSIWLTPWQPLSIVAGGSFVDARYQSFPNAVAPATSEVPQQDLSGRRVPFVPEWQVDLIPRLVFPFRMPDLPFVGRLREPLALTAALDVLARGALYIDTALDPRTRQSPHVLVNARTGFFALDEALSLTLGVSNLTNADVLTSAANNAAFPTGLDVFQEFQRNWSLEAVYRW
jgi:iron complex outermembrane receptor protein